MKAKLMKIFSVIMIVIVVVGGYWFFHRYEVSTDNAVIEGRNVVISPKVAGYVKTLNITDNQVVTKGQVLLEIDSTDYLIKRNKAYVTNSEKKIIFSNKPLYGGAYPIYELELKKFSNGGRIWSSLK